MAAERSMALIDVIPVLRHCFSHFYNADLANASIHCSSVRYSPITFRLAELLGTKEGQGLSFDLQVMAVLEDSGKYDEDKGR